MANIRDRQSVEQLYVNLLLSRNLTAEFLRIILGPYVFAGFLGIVIATFVTVKHSKMPIYVYAFFPVAAAAGLMIQFLNIYGGMYVIRICNNILRRLLSADHACLTRLPRKDRQLFMLKARSLRPVSLPLGDFAKFSLSSMWNLSKEIVNQVLLLLSL